MDRRRFILWLGLLWPVSAITGAQAQSDKTYRLGMLLNTHDQISDAVLKALREHGYVDGQNLTVEWRFSEGDPQRWLPLARDLVSARPNVIYVQTTPAALAAKQVTSTIPIVIPTAIDPVGAGLADSLARPSGNVTGLAMLQPEITGKALSLLKEAVPTLKRVAVVWNAGNPANAPVWRQVEATAGSEGLVLSSQPVRDAAEFAPAFAAISAQRPDGVLVLIDAFMTQYLRQVVDFIEQQRLPAVTTSRFFPALGGLMSYGASDVANARKAADYIDRILKGANPGDLPFEQPTTFELVINLRTAKVLGLTLPPLLVTRADEIIE